MADRQTTEMRMYLKHIKKVTHEEMKVRKKKENCLINQYIYDTKYFLIYFKLDISDC